MDSLGEVAHPGTRQHTQTKLVEYLKTNDIAATHFLYIIFTYDIRYFNGDKQNLKAALRTRAFQLIQHKYTHNINGNPDDQVFIHWKSPNKTNSSLYYSTCRFDEMYVRQLTKVHTHNCLPNCLILCRG
jgi:hypothetical protein